MKVKPEHIEHMRTAIAPHDTAAQRARVLEWHAAGNYPAKDVDKRYRWDLMYCAKLTGWLCDTLYPYADDTHVDTALRAIVAPLAP